MYDYLLFSLFLIFLKLFEKHSRHFEYNNAPPLYSPLNIQLLTSLLYIISIKPSINLSDTIIIQSFSPFSLFNTEDSIAIPCSVKTIGRYFK